jgi:two-component system chemotaxis sensor kinase CheA
MDPVLEIFFEEAAELLADFEAGVLDLEGTPGDLELLNRIFRAAHTIKGNAGMLGFEDLARFTHGLESLLDRFRSAEQAVTSAAIDMLLAAGDAIRGMLRIAQMGGEPTVAERDAAHHVRERLEVLLAPPEESGVKVALPPIGAATARETDDDGPVAMAASIRVPIAKVDRLINLVGELVITQSMVADAVTHFGPERLAALADSVAQMDRHARDLHEQVLAVRMVPVRSLFARVPRIVRDVAATLEKQVRVDIVGEETELDRTVIERIGDPLTHLVRNAIDHGIETPAERRATGKADAGRIRLEAYQQGGNIYIEISDDGRGLDRERILAKAIASGLVPADQRLEDEAIWQLVFHPGFSTAARVTQVSGRGVGMDVVRRNVEALGGAITIATSPGAGTRFRIKLPLTLAIMDGQAVRVGSQEYILPLSSIRETVRPARANVHNVGIDAELVLVHGQPLPIVRLHRLFGVEPTTPAPWEGLLVIIEHDRQAAALLVDELLGQQQVVIKSLEANYTKVDGIAGATILGDGRVALILDVAGLIALATTDGRPWRAVA